VSILVKQTNLFKRIGLAWLLALLVVPSVLAQHSSPNYSIEESFVGPGGLIDASSPNYQARASLGDTGIGNSASANFQIYGGYTTTDEEFLEFVVTGATVDLGVLTDSSTGTGNGTFYVRTYIAQGYAVTTMSQPPTLSGGTATIEPMAAQGASAQGTEQFGINLVANTSPTTFGADPVQVPDSTFSFGFAAANYDDANQYRYVPGDVVAQSDSSSGQTTYTVSYIANVAFLTEAGTYIMHHDLVATSTF
jgi:hypothetical protein